jgi:hypothetical protein
MVLERGQRLRPAAPPPGTWRLSCPLAAAILAAIYAVSAADLSLRARAACREGEWQLRLSREPALREAEAAARLDERKQRLSRSLAEGLVTPSEFETSLALARMERERFLEESPAKLAFVWFKTAAALFSPPRSPWSLRARAGMAEARALWEKDLKAAGVEPQERFFQ